MANEVVQRDLEILIDEVTPEDRHVVAGLMDLVDEYEHGNFARGLSEFVPSLISGHQLSPRAMVSLMRIAHYVNELLRAEVRRTAALHDFPGNGD